MKSLILSASLVVLAVVFIVSIPQTSSLIEAVLVNSQIPENNAEVAGIQKYSSLPVSRNIVPPTLSAKAVLVKDLATGTILYQKEASVPLPIASTTKIMTALVASEHFDQNSSLTVGDGADITGATVGLLRGEDLSFRSLLYGMLLNSGNDAAFTIAENYPGGILGFVSAMNKKAVTLNLPNTHFDNPAGFDSPNHYSSASDLAKITEESLKNETLVRVFATKETSIVSLDKKHQHKLSNLNQLLTQVRGVLGVKTGYTEAAKENLVTYVNREGREILTVILGSDDRFGESTQLIEWAYNNFNWPNLQNLN